MIGAFSINLKSLLAVGALVDAPVPSQAEIHPRARLKTVGSI
jgi:hypothetical protein